MRGLGADVQSHGDVLLPDPRNRHSQRRAGHGTVARAAVRLDGPQRDEPDDVFQENGEQRSGAGQSGRNIAFMRGAQFIAALTPIDFAAVQQRWSPESAVPEDGRGAHAAVRTPPVQAIARGLLLKSDSRSRFVTSAETGTQPLSDEKA